MALIQVNYLSRALFRTVPVNVVLPADRISVEAGGYAMKPGRRFKTLVLLHGLLGNYTDWVSGTRILSATRAFRDRLAADGVSVTYDEEDRGHDWDFWDSQIKKVLDWLPLERTDGGLGSGNVGRLD